MGGPSGVPTSYLAGLAFGLVGAVAGLAVFALLEDTVFNRMRTGWRCWRCSCIAPALAYSYADVILLARERYESYAGLELSHSSTLLVIGAALCFRSG